MFNRRQGVRVERHRACVRACVLTWKRARTIWIRVKIYCFTSFISRTRAVHWHTHSHRTHAVNAILYMLANGVLYIQMNVWTGVFSSVRFLCVCVSVCLATRSATRAAEQTILRCGTALAVRWTREANASRVCKVGRNTDEMRVKPDNLHRPMFAMAREVIIAPSGGK